MKEYINIMENKFFNTPSPAFSEFRSLMDIWDRHCLFENEEKNINDLLDRNQMILFFTKDGNLYGAPEESRIVFARLKSGDEDEDAGFKDEAQFLGINLLKALMGDPEESTQTVFKEKDIPHIHVCDRDKAVKTILNYKPKKDKK